MWDFEAERAALRATIDPDPIHRPKPILTLADAEQVARREWDQGRIDQTRWPSRGEFIAWRVTDLLQ